MPPKPETQNLKPNPSASLYLCVSLLILLIATFFSILALGNAHRFHPDEAFYMTFARNAAVNGDWLLISEPVDKPPLTFYSNALSLVFLAVESDENGVLQLDPLKGELAGRIPSVLMSVILVAVLMALAKSLNYPFPLASSPLRSEEESNLNPLIVERGGDLEVEKTSDKGVAYLTGLLAALSPFRIVFAATAFTDLPMLLFATISLWMAVRRKWFWTGFWFIVSIWAKPQSIFYVPLIVGFLILRQYKSDTIHPTSQNHSVGIASLLSARKNRQATHLQRGFSAEGFFRFFLPIILGGLLLCGWDMARVAQGAESFFVLGQSRYTQTMITPLVDYPTRLLGWWATVQYLFGNGLLTGIILGIGIVGTTRRKNILNLVLAGWLLLFSLVHIVLTLNLFDRNQIVLMPVAVMVVSLGITDTIHPVPTIKKPSVGAAWVSILNKIILFTLLLCFSVFSLLASLHQLPIGGDDGRHDGIHELADYLNSKPVATIIYDPWLDWELDYYMGIWTNKRRVFYPRPELLIADALGLDEIGTRYFLVPANIDASEWIQALYQVRFTITLDYEMNNFRVWAIVPPQS